MNKIRDIIWYRQTTDLSERKIARALAVSRTVVARTLQAYRTSGLEWSEVPCLADSVLQQRLTMGTPPAPKERYPERKGESDRKLYVTRDEVKPKEAQPAKRTPASR